MICIIMKFLDGYDVRLGVRIIGLDEFILLVFREKKQIEGIEVKLDSLQNYKCVLDKLKYFKDICYFIIY